MKEYSAVYKRKQLVVEARDVNEALAMASSYFGCKTMGESDKIMLTFIYDYETEKSQ